MTGSAALHHRLAATALQAAEAGGRAALVHFRRPDVAVEWKADDSPVTIADREAEAACLRCIAAAYPDDAAEGEESASHPGRSGRTWVIDPIDGTRNFIAGIPLWATLVACLEEGRVVAAAAVIPALEERYDAVLGGGARCNGAPIQVSGRTRLEEARWCFETPGWYQRCGLGPVFDELCRRTALQRGLCDAYAHMLVASGRADLVIEPHLHVWDIAATSLIVSEAGGRWSDLDGASDLRAGHAVVSNGHLHAAALGLLASHPRPAPGG